MWGAYRALAIHIKDRGELLEKLPDVLKTTASQFINSVPFGEYAIKHLSSVYEASHSTTLAPLHYIFSLAFIPAVDDYQAFLVASRFFSFLEYVLFVLIFIKAIRLFKSRTVKAIGYFILVLSAMSGMMIYYSVQGHNYMASVLAMAALLYWIKRSEATSRHIPLRTFSILYSIALFTSYSFVIYLPAYFLVYCAVLVNSSYFKSLAYIQPVQYLSKFIWLIIPIAQAFLLKRYYITPSASGAGWQVGFNSEYVIVHGDGFFHNVAKIFPAIRDTLGSVFLYQGSSIALDSLFVIPTLLIVGFSFTILVWRLQNNTRFYSLMFAQAVLVTHLFLYLAGILALSPTRHSIILFPVISWILIETTNGLRVQLLPPYLTRLCLPHVLYRPKAILFSGLVILSIYSFVATVSTINDVRLKRLDPLPANRNILDSAQYVMYAPYYNFGISIYSMLNGKKETPVPIPESHQPATLLVGKQKNTSPRPYFLYVTNDPVKPTKTTVEKHASQYQCFGNAETIFSQPSQTIIDPVRSPITLNGTNSFHIIKVGCQK